MEIVPQLTSGHILRYRRSNGAWIEYRVYNYKPICFTHRNTSVSFVYAENTDPNATPEEKFVVFLEYQQNYDDFLVSLKYFTPKLHHQILPRQTRIFVVNSTEANHQFLLSNNGRWHFLQAPNLLARIQFHYEEEPTLIPTPGFYVPKTLLGIPAPLLVEPLPKNQPVLPVPLPRPSSQPRVNPGPRQERADSDAVCITNPGKISLFELQNRLKTFINEEKYKSLHIPPRSYQLEDLKKLYQGAQDCTKAIYALVNPAPTGYGKTVFSAMLFSALRVRTLFLVPANILIGQTVNEFKKMIPDARVIAYESAYSFESVLNNNDVIVTTIQMLQFDGRYKDKFSKAMSVIGYVIFDEAHACISEARNHIVQMFMQMKCHALGLTATPLEEVYNAFGYFSDGRDNPIPRRSLIENINLGILPHVSLNMIDCPALYAKKSLAVATNSNTATTSTDMHLDNDDSPDDSDEDVEQSDSRIRNLLTDVYFNSADQLTNHFYFGMKGIIFVQRNADATELANHFNKIYQDNKQHPKIIKFEEEFQPGEDFHFAEAVHSNVDDCEKVIADFKANKIRVLIGVKMIAVGFDDKEVKFVALSQTNSHTHLVQSAGRGLRTPSTLMEMMDGHLVNYKTTHFVQVFLGNKKVKYFFNELKVTNNDKITVKFNHGLTENDINIHVLPAYPKIATQLDVEYKLRAQPTEADETLLRKLYRTEIHMIGGYPFTRDQLEKMPVHIRNILEVLEDQHKVIAIKLKNFDNVEVHTEHVLQKRSLDTSRADTSSKRSVVDDSERSDVVVPRITSAVRNQLVQKLDDVLDRFEEIHTETGNKKGQNGSSKSTGIKLSKKKIDLSQLLTYMLSRYKDLYRAARNV